MGEPFQVLADVIGTHPASAVPLDEPRVARLRLGFFVDVQARRDEHADRCTGRGLLPNPCVILRAYDLELARLWASIVELGVTPGDLYAIERAAE
jgi:hypothetical protein